MPKPKILTTYLCNVCNSEYSTYDKAMECESKPARPHKYHIGKVVTVIAKGDILKKGQRYYATITRQVYRPTDVLHIPCYEVTFHTVGIGGIGGFYRESEIIE